MLEVFHYTFRMALIFTDVQTVPMPKLMEMNEQICHYLSE